MHWAQHHGNFSLFDNVPRYAEHCMRDLLGTSKTRWHTSDFPNQLGNGFVTKETAATLHNDFQIDKNQSYSMVALNKCFEVLWSSKWLRIRFYYFRDIYRNYFTGLGRLGNIYRNSGVSTGSERWQPAVRGTPRITGLAPVPIIYRKKITGQGPLRNN